jgi:hypothetical protein
MPCPSPPWLLMDLGTVYVKHFTAYVAGACKGIAIACLKFNLHFSSSHFMQTELIWIFVV